MTCSAAGVTPSEAGAEFPAAGNRPTCLTGMPDGIPVCLCPGVPLPKPTTCTRLVDTGSAPHLRTSPNGEYAEMSITLSSVARTQLDQVYRAVDIILAKGEAHAKEKGVEDSVWLNWRLSPDMFAFTRQVQLVSDFTVRGMSRLAGVEPASLPDTETSFAELRARVAKAREAVWALDTDAIDANPQADITFPAGRDREMTLPRQTYLQSFVITNAIFHASTAYNILRQLGVPVGKADMMGMSG